MPEAARLRGLLVDWGGVLTGDMRVAVEAWARAVAVPLDAYVGIMRDWMGEPYGTEALLNPVHALERGEMTVPDFEVRLADALTERTGVVLRADGLLARMFETFEHALDLLGLDPEECVFVDDLPHNVAAAEALGMVGVRHRSYAETLVELEALFGIALS